MMLKAGFDFSPVYMLLSCCMLSFVVNLGLHDGSLPLVCVGVCTGQRSVFSVIFQAFIHIFDKGCKLVLTQT